MRRRVATNTNVTAYTYGWWYRWGQGDIGDLKGRGISILQSRTGNGPGIGIRLCRRAGGAG